MELIMEKIRSKANQYKSFAECAKALRMSQLEKRFPMDVADRNQLQKCLDTLQQSMKVSSLQGMVERLESISRQLSLKLMAGQTGLELFISSDMFYLEVSLELSGNVKDVKVHHEGKSEQQSCDELVKSLSRGDFDDFTTQLQGLISIYQLNAEKKVKCKAFSALCALETDLDAIWTAQCSIKDVQYLLNKSPVGVLERRKGGHPMKLTYFVSPYEILETKKELSIESIQKHKIGCNVTICLEGSAAHKLQTSPLVTISKASGKSIPSYTTMTPANSTTLPAYFVLKLNKPQPICVELVNHINAITELECCDLSNTHPLFSLITQHVSNGKMDSSHNKGLFVNLPDQVHCYFMTECKGLDGVVVSSIPFTHPSQVSQILTLLRQQTVFNALVASAIRPHSKQDMENMYMLEITALSWQHISVSFELPLQESMSTIEIDLTDISAVKAKLYSTGTEANIKTSSEHISKVLQRCLSIPVTMRYLIRILQSQQVEMSLNSMNNGSFSSAPNGGLGNGSDHSPMDTSKIKQEPRISNGLNGRNSTLGSQFDDFSSFSNTVLESNMQKTASILNLVSDSQKKKRKHDKHWKNSKQRSIDDSDILLESSSNDSASLGTSIEVDLEHDFKEEMMDPSELDDVEEMLKVTAGPARSDFKIKKPKEVKKSPSHTSLIMDLTDGKGLVPPSVTITPITSSVANLSSVLERRPGIEIIPLSNSAPSNLTSSITITPISGPSDREEKKNPKNRSIDDKIRGEKKRKRKREDEGGTKMGPPEKVPMKSDPLSKPVSVSIKPATDSPPALNRPNSPSVRKYTMSPTQLREKSTGSSIHPSPKNSPAYGSSPKHSPKHSTSSPKQPSSSSGKPSMSTLKSASSSPNSLKNSETKMKSSSSSSGASGASSGSKERDKDSFRKSSGSSSSSSSGSPKIKSSSVKLKQLELSNEISVTTTGSSTPPNSNALGDPKNMANPLQRNRKGSLSAVIDKLKSAQEVVDPISMNTKRDPSNGGSSKDGKMSSSGSGSTISKVSIDGKTAMLQKVPDGVKNPTEYMVKSSLEGIKITINKTRTKDSSKTSKIGSSSGSGSPKTHTGLKPGVISGPASKKSVSSKPSGMPGLPSKISSSTMKSSSSGLKTSSSLAKSLSSKSTGSPKMSGSGPTDLSRKENMGKSRPPKTGSDKSVFKEGVRKSSPAPSRDDEPERAFKVIKMDSGLPPVVEGLMKPFDTKFQIPKLSARNNNNANTGSSSSTSSSSHMDCSSATTGSTDNSEASSSNSNNNNNNIKGSAEKLLEKSEVKLVDLASKSNLDIAANLKYHTSKHDSDRMAKVPSLNVPNLLSLPMALTNVSPKLPMTSPNLPTTSMSSITSKLDRGDDNVLDTVLGEKHESEAKASTVDVASVKFQSASSIKSDDLKKSTDLPKHVIGSQPSSDNLLNFSSSSALPLKLSDNAEKTSVGAVASCFTKPSPPAMYSKSPAHSPLSIIPSPSSQSITDDELMEEGLMIRK